MRRALVVNAVRVSRVVVMGALGLAIAAGGCASSSSSPSLTFQPPEVFAPKPAAPVDPSTIPCPLMPPQEAFLEQLLARWRVTLTEELKQPQRPLPWTLIVGKDCVYHLSPRRDLEGGKHLTTGLMWSGRPLVVYAMGHVGKVTLPNGKALPRGAHAFVDRAGDEDFFVLSLVELWRSHPEVSAAPNPSEAVIDAGMRELKRTATAGPLLEESDPAARPAEASE